jgi:hypothetical protein
MKIADGVPIYHVAQVAGHLIRTDVEEGLRECGAPEIGSRTSSNAPRP